MIDSCSDSNVFSKSSYLLNQNRFAFYHIRLYRYMVVELRPEKINSEFEGKLNFYVTAIYSNMKAEEDNQTIGILICKDEDDVVIEYALDGMS